MGHRPSWLLLGFRSVSHAAVLHEPAGRAGGGRKARWLQSVADVLASHGARRQTRLVRAHDGGLRDGHGADLPPLLLDATQGHRGARQFGAQGLSAGRWLSGASAGIAKTFPGKWFERADVAHVATDGHVLTVPRRGLFFVTFCT